MNILGLIVVVLLLLFVDPHVFFTYNKDIVTFAKEEQKPLRIIEDSTDDGKKQQTTVELDEIKVSSAVVSGDKDKEKEKGKESNDKPAKEDMELASYKKREEIYQRILRLTSLGLFAAFFIYSYIHLHPSSSYYDPTSDPQRVFLVILLPFVLLVSLFLESRNSQSVFIQTLCKKLSALDRFGLLPINKGQTIPRYQEYISPSRLPLMESIWYPILLCVVFGGFSGLSYGLSQENRPFMLGVFFGLTVLVALLNVIVEITQKSKNEKKEGENNNKDEEKARYYLSLVQWAYFAVLFYLGIIGIYLHHLSFSI